MKIKIQKICSLHPGLKYNKYYMEAYMSTYINEPSYIDVQTFTFTPLDIGIAVGCMILGIGLGTMIVKQHDNDCVKLEDLTNKRDKYRQNWNNYLEQRAY